MKKRRSACEGGTSTIVSANFSQVPAKVAHRIPVPCTHRTILLALSLLVTNLLLLDPVMTNGCLQESRGSLELEIRNRWGMFIGLVYCL